MPVKPKAPVCETIPDEFACFMGEVRVLIDRGDPSALIESDDLLQCERAYGGLYDSAAGRYGFAYFVDDDRKADASLCWEFDLDKQEIRDIAAGEVKEIQMWRCAAHDCGRRFPRVDSYCAECDFPPE